MAFQTLLRTALPLVLLWSTILGCGTAIEAETDQSRIGSNSPTVTQKGDNLPPVPDESRAEPGGPAVVVNDPPEAFAAVEARKPDPPADDPNDIAALKKLGVEFDTDAYGRVTEIDFQKKKATDKTLGLIKRFDQLEVLNLDKTGVTDAQLSVVMDFKKLTSLSLEENAITDDGLTHLEKMEQLEVLSLMKTKVTGKGLHHLKDLTNLRVLNLSYCNIGDKALRYLTDMELLETLALQKTNLKGSGLRYVGKLKNMITLNLDDSSIEGLNLLHLKPCQKLRIIYMRDSFVSKRSVNKLEGLVPSLAIFQ